MMKRWKSLLLAVLLLGVTVLAAACGGGSLPVPAGFGVDDEDMLSWTAVEDARAYDVEIKNVESGEVKTESNTHRTQYSLAALGEGDYEIRIRAVGGASNDVFSEWSSALAFHKDRDTGLLYTLINNGTEYAVRGVTTASGDIVIGEQYRGKYVTQIAEGAFRSNSKVERVVVPDSVRTIAKSAFYNTTKMASIVLPDGLSDVGAYAFYGCSGLTEVKLPAALTEIPEFAFAYCRALESVEFGDDVTSVGEAAFVSCSALKSVTLPDSVVTVGVDAFSLDSDVASVSIGSGARTIEKGAFYGCRSLASLTFAPLPEGAELTVGDTAFARCSALKKLELPEGVVSVGQDAFRESTDLAEISLPESLSSLGAGAFSDTAYVAAQTAEGSEADYVYVGKWLVSVSDEIRQNLENLTENDLREDTVGIAAQAFYGRIQTENGIEYGGPYSLQSIQLPDSVRYIGDYAFYNTNHALSTLIVGENAKLESIGFAAFAFCVYLNNVQFRGSALADIGGSAFQGCSSLNNNSNNAELLVPSSVTHIGSNAFLDTALWERTPDAGVVYAGNWVVGCNSSFASAVVDLRATVRGVSDYAFRGQASLQNVTGLNRARQIGRGAFYGCLALASVSLNANLRKIEPYTFYACGSLANVSFPLLLESIGECAFAGCLQLSELDFSNTRLKEIGRFAFYACQNVRSVTFGDSLETIDGYAFYANIRFREIALPDSLRTIGERAFGLCASLQRVDFGEGVETVERYAFRECTNLLEIDLPASVKTIGDYAFYLCTAVTKVVLREGLESIGRYAFYGNISLKSLVLPNGIERIGESAFRCCFALTSVTLLGETGFIDGNVFSGSEYLTFYATEEAPSDAWSGNWNSYFRTSFWGVEVDETGTVVSIETGKARLPHERFGVSGPAREGYVFVGWAETPDGEAVYTADEAALLEEGKTLYAVWRERTPEDDAPAAPETGDETPPATGGETETN